MKAKELAELLLQTPDAEVEVILPLPDGVLELEPQDFPVTHVSHMGDTIYICGDDDLGINLDIEEE